MRFKNESMLEYLDHVRDTMDSVYVQFESLYYDLADYLCPTLPQFASTDVNLGDRRSIKIVDSSATLFAKVEEAGMMSSITSPSRPWFQLSVRDPRLSKNASVKMWLAECNQRMLNSLVLSNFYAEIMLFYSYAVNFGTSVLYLEEDLTGKDMKFKCLPIGSYRLLDDSDGRCNTISFVWRYTVRDLLREFAKTDAKGNIDWSNFSQRVKDFWEKDNQNEIIEVVHIVCPNPDWEPGARLAKDQKWVSYYYEKDSVTQKRKGLVEEDVFLRKSGFAKFPFYAFRWKRNPGDVYATDCPGITALSDCKQLQAMVEKQQLAIEKGVDPPLVVPSSMESSSVNLMPGGITYSDSDNSAAVRPLMDVRINLADLESTMSRIRDRLAQAFAVHLFRSISQLSDEPTQKMTATEVRARQQEGMRQLGPILEQLNDSVFGPMIDDVFDILWKHGRLPAAPAELKGTDLGVDYISVMAQAQKLESLGSSERFLGIIQQVATYDPQVLDVANTEFILRDIADILSLSPRATRTAEETAAVRQRRAEMVEAQQKAATLQQAAQGVSSLANTPPEGVLKDQLSALESAGVTTPVGAQ